MVQISFPDRMVSYDTFMNDLAHRVAAAIVEQREMPEYVSQRKAYTLFGRGNVDRWRKQGRINPCKRPGKVEYRTAELQVLQHTQQDYFNL